LCEIFKEEQIHAYLTEDVGDLPHEN
jgi:hypothetical protein